MDCITDYRRSSWCPASRDIWRWFGMGGFIGAAIGLAVYFVLILGLAAILSLATGKPFFSPKKKRVDDA